MTIEDRQDEVRPEAERLASCVELVRGGATESWPSVS